jgi:ubiquinol-cytochrome c reductase cytochrome c1 subunit
MRHAVAALALLLFQGAASAKTNGHMMHYEADLSNRESLQRGAQLFVNYCLSCHSAAYMRYNRLGRDLEIPEDILKANLMFGTGKTGDTMTVAMKPQEAEQWFGVAPPDLSVIARARGASWLYSYFMTFYRDPSRPTGVNNLIFKDVAMPHVLWQLQGWQRPVFSEETAADGTVMRAITGLELESPGRLDEAGYRRAVADLVNFLVYLGEPIKLKRQQIGAWVIVYLLALLVIVYLLKREYWKDVH